LRGRTGRR